MDIKSNLINKIIEITGRDESELKRFSVVQLQMIKKKILEEYDPEMTILIVNTMGFLDMI